jgi:O-glycosyl hydrolase
MSLHPFSSQFSQVFKRIVSFSESSELGLPVIRLLFSLSKQDLRGFGGSGAFGLLLPIEEG